eukprot:gene5029-34815_t
MCPPCPQILACEDTVIFDVLRPGKGNLTRSNSLFAVRCPHAPAAAGAGSEEELALSLDRPHTQFLTQSDKGPCARDTTMPISHMLATPSWLMFITPFNGELWCNHLCKDVALLLNVVHE